mmetsp:Transcript_12608/g.11435  ORF Transcript_12608/g.11435 Transcript_12608/m.11435 type:complete len:223 (+) Transcript_12608:938-1606(+)
MVAIIHVLVLPPNESCNKRVNLLSLYFICLAFPSAKAEITLPRVSRDKLMPAPSFNICPVAPVFFCLSDPAKSTRFNLPARTCSLPDSSVVLISITTENIECDLEDSLFICVDATVRCLIPFSNCASNCSSLSTTTCVKFLTYIPFTGSSPISHFGLFLVAGDNKSKISSLYISKYEHRIRNLTCLVALIYSKICENAFGVTPLSSSFSIIPCIVKDFPDPV